MHEQARKSQSRLAAGIARRRAALFLQLKTAWGEYERDYARYYAVAIVYYALVSLVPLLLLLLALLALLPRFSAAAAHAENQVLASVEASFGPEFRETIDRLFGRLQEGSLVATFVSLGGLLVSASVLFRHLRMTFRAVWKYSPPLVSGTVRAIMRATALEAIIAFAMVLGGGALLLLAFGLLAAIRWVGTFVSGVVGGNLIGWLLALAGPTLIVLGTFALLFKFLPPVRLRWRHVWLAATLSALAWLAGAEILALYGSFLTRDRGAYGALGGLLVIMLCMSAVTKVLFFGAELCKVVYGATAAEPKPQP